MSTEGSLAFRVLPRWAQILGLGDVRLVGCDLPPHAPANRYRQVVRQIKDNPDERGAVITAHKLDLYRTCLDLFDQTGDDARLCGEASCLSKHGGPLRATATDPAAAGAALSQFLPSGHWAATGGQVLCFGAGGSATAITLHLMTGEPQAVRPSRITVVDRDPARLEMIGAFHRKLASSTPVSYVCNSDPSGNDRLIAALPAASLVVNATGMGKDAPGSPITDTAEFPIDSLAWDLNYRGDLTFLRQAARQQATRCTTTEDGWRYFLLGWTTAISQIFALHIGERQLSRIFAVAAAERAR